MKFENIKIYSDGSCYNKIGEGGIGIYIPLLDRKISIGVKNTSSDRTEILGLLHSLVELNTVNFTKATIYIDNQYVVKTITQKWLVRWIRNGEYGRKNLDLWIPIWEFMETHNRNGRKIELVWIKGHSKAQDFNTKCNHIADMLADYKQKFELTIIDNVKFE